MTDKLKRNFARTLSYTCWTMLGIMVIWKGNLDRGMGMSDCIVGIALFFAGLISYTYEFTSSAAARKAAR